MLTKSLSFTSTLLVIILLVSACGQNTLDSVDSSGSEPGVAPSDTLAPVSKADPETMIKSLFYEIDFNDSLVSVKEKLKKYCRSFQVIDIESPSFPLAKNSENHLICEEIKIDGNVIQEVAFVFADDKLALIEARGGAIKTLSSKTTSEASPYMDYQVFLPEMMFVNIQEDAAWLLTQDSLHPNLFTWSNPYLPSNGGKNQQYDSSVEIPQPLKFGATINELTPFFEKQCPLIQVEKIDEPWLPTKPKEQTQINCFGFEYAGFPRKIEAVFGDGILELAWILTGKGEEDRIHKALVQTYSEPEFVNDDWEAFHSWKIALRKDKPEILVLSERLAPIYKEKYQKE